MGPARLYATGGDTAQHMGTGAERDEARRDEREQRRGGAGARQQEQKTKREQTGTRVVVLADETMGRGYWVMMADGRLDFMRLVVILRNTWARGPNETRRAEAESGRRRREEGGRGGEEGGDWKEG